MKPLIVLTSFWDANELVKNKMVPFKNTLVNLNKTSFGVYSIAIQTPKLDKLGSLNELYPHGLTTVGCFCPTYSLLKQYKNDKDWDAYCEDFDLLMRNRKFEVQAWVKKLMNDYVYIYCCWENLHEGTHCHREILYNMFMQSKRVSSGCDYILRTGVKD